MLSKNRISIGILFLSVIQLLPIICQGEFETPPIVVKDPGKASLTEGDTLKLNVIVFGIPEPTLQWYKDGVEISGEDTDTFKISTTTILDSGRYHVEVQNSEGIAVSKHARVTVRPNHFDKSVARQWNEEILAAIRTDYPAPTVHSRNLFHMSAAMYDAWCAYDEGPAIAYYTNESLTHLETAESDVLEAVSHAAYTILNERYKLSPNADESLAAFKERMVHLGYDPNDRNILGNSPAAVGNRIGASILSQTIHDGANERFSYEDQTNYQPVNDPLVFKISGIDGINDPNHWQPLAFDHLVLQNGIPVGKAIQTFLGPNWGSVTPFALEKKPGQQLWIDLGPPPFLNTDDSTSETHEEFIQSVIEVIEYSSWLDPNDPTTIDISPGARHNNSLGQNDGTGYAENPVTGEPYLPNLVNRADYGRVLAEFWADGPDSETPPGHWNSMANQVSEHPEFKRVFGGAENAEEIDELEWDIKTYFALNAGLSDAAIACWENKRHYDYVRPITMIRYLASIGQSSFPENDFFNTNGLPIIDNLVEVITSDSSAPGERHAHLAEYIGEIALRCWQGIPNEPATQSAGVGWIRAADWMPFQRDTFVTPPFGAYTSGHSTFSRAAAEVLTLLTGNKFFPGGIASFSAKKNSFLEFEAGPQNDITLTWATYYDAADEAGLSRLYGGIHVAADDLVGRKMGSTIGVSAFEKAQSYFDGTITLQETANSYEKWASAIIASDPQNSDPNDKIGQSTLTNLERFVLGLNPLEPGDDTDRLFQPSFDLNDRLLQFSLEVLYGTESNIHIELSNDLKNWSPIQMTDLTTSATTSNQGRVEYTIHSNTHPVPNTPSFIRITLNPDAFGSEE
ncbi:immunoglobulin domain-containing protein [Puniceicoccaceae bacterium K14]|nr:immunoglobulin domain-containing protein [Puniceicoccaceae bacterium K14]